MRIRKTFTPGMVLVALVSLPPLAATAQEASAPDTGTDPSRLSTAIDARYEYLDLGNFSSGTFKLAYTLPFGAKRDFSLRLRVPLTYVDVFGNDNHGLGDVSLQLVHVFGLTRKRAFVAQAELLFDTAGRPELGSGRDVLKGTLIYARFLDDGAIFAPAWVQTNSLGGDGNRAEVNSTTFDFYYVPKTSDPRNLVTYDPALTHDWENHKTFASLAVTVGRVLGPAFGGNAIVSIKPSLFFGNDRPADWGLEVGYKIIGF
jgi:hypothetical protein